MHHVINVLADYLPFVAVDQFQLFLGVVDGNNGKIFNTTSLSNAHQRIQFQNIVWFGIQLKVAVS